MQNVNRYAKLSGLVFIPVVSRSLLLLISVRYTGSSSALAVLGKRGQGVRRGEEGGEGVSWKPFSLGLSLHSSQGALI